MTAVPSFTQSHCNACGGDRNHVILHCAQSSWSEDDGQYSGTDRYETLQCAGCDSIKLKHYATRPSEPYESITDFPAAVFRPRPRWMFDLILDQLIDEGAIVDLHNEIYVALQHGLLRLAAMGVRALIERIIISKVGDKRSFAANVESFEQAGYVSRLQKERLLAILEVGHATIHRDFNPMRDDVIILIDITEHIIESVYIHESKVKGLSVRVPKRPPRGSAVGGSHSV